MKTAILLLAGLFLFCACKKNISAPSPDVTPLPSDEEPIQKLAADAARKIQFALQAHEVSAIQFQKLQSREIFSGGAFVYFENALAAQLATKGIQRTINEWKLDGVLSKEEGQIVFAFRILRGEELISSETSRIPDDERLRLTLAQFEMQAPVSHHDHSIHKEMPVPTPLAKLDQIPLDLAEHCVSQGPCSLLILYPSRLVERDWSDGSEREIPIAITGQRSRAPSGKILKLPNIYYILNNQFAVPLALNTKLEQVKNELPSRLPQPEPGLNTYALSDGRFFDFEEFGEKGLAVINSQNRLAVADQGKLVFGEQPVGGSLETHPPYIYVTGDVLPDSGTDFIHKFAFSDGLLRFVESQKIEGAVYDITITDLNQDQKPEMLLTVKHDRGIFIEVREPF